MRDVWQLQEAKNRFSEVVNAALHHGPQTISRRGKKTVIIIAIRDYEKKNGPATNFIAFMQSSPLATTKLDLSRSKELARKVEL